MDREIEFLYRTNDTTSEPFNDKALLRIFFFPPRKQFFNFFDVTPELKNDKFYKNNTGNLLVKII